MPTRNTKGSDVPRSEFLASGPPRWEFSGMMEEWSEEHWERMDAEGMLSPPPLPVVAVLLSLV